MAFSAPNSLPSISRSTALLTAAGCAAVTAVSWMTLHIPASYAHLNWKPGFASVFEGPCAYALPAMLALSTTIHLFRTRNLALIPVLFAALLWLLSGQDVARYVGAATGVAKVDCWAPSSRECLVGKFERLEKLKESGPSVVLTENEQAVFSAFKETRRQFEASRPSGYGDEFKTWAQSYAAALDKVFAGYPSAYAE